MIERYHLDLALLAAVIGVALLPLESGVPFIGRRAVATSCMGGAVLGSLGTNRAAPWLVAAALVLLPADRRERPHPLGSTTTLLGVAALAGIWAAVPDTEAPLATAFVLLPLAAVSLCRDSAPGPAGTAALVVAVAGAAWTGSAGWGSALASIGAVGLMATAPLVFGFRRIESRMTAAILLGTQLILGLGLPRLLMWRSAGVAAAMAVAANAAVFAAVALLARRSGDGHARSSVTPTP